MQNLVVNQYIFHEEIEIDSLSLILPIDSSDESNKKTKPESKKLAPEKKKLKLQPTARSRLMKICDSSSDEEDVKPPVEEIEAETIEVKKEKENKTPSPEKNGSGQGQANDSSGSTGGKKRVKVKKMVTKTYEDEEGFISKHFTFTDYAGLCLLSIYKWELNFSLQTLFANWKKSVVLKKKRKLLCRQRSR